MWYGSLLARDWATRQVSMIWGARLAGGWKTREAIGEILGARLTGLRADRLIFTSGGTEANNLALRGSTTAPGQLIVSAIEHPSVLQPAEFLAQHGTECIRLPVDCQGRTSADALAERLNPRVRLVSVMLANHETGVLQPVEQMAAVCREKAVLLHTDAVQAVGKIPLDFRRLDVDMLSFSANKFHGPVEVGGLLLRHGIRRNPYSTEGSNSVGYGLEPSPWH